MGSQYRLTKKFYIYFQLKEENLFCTNAPCRIIQSLFDMMVKYVKPDLVGKKYYAPYPAKGRVLPKAVNEQAKHGACIFFNTFMCT